jgi:hypothetical protein
VKKVRQDEPFLLQSENDSRGKCIPDLESALSEDFIGLPQAASVTKPLKDLQ